MIKNENIENLKEIRKCENAECDKRAIAKGLCRKHYVENLKNRKDKKETNEPETTIKSEPDIIDVVQLKRSCTMIVYMLMKLASMLDERITMPGYEDCTSTGTALYNVAEKYSEQSMMIIEYTPEIMLVSEMIYLIKNNIKIKTTTKSEDKNVLKYNFEEREREEVR